MVTTAGTMYKLTDVPAMLEHAGIKLQAQQLCRWEEMVSAELLSKAQQARKRSSSDLMESETPETPAASSVSPEDEQQTGIGIRWPTVRAGTQDRTPVVPQTAQHTLAQFLSVKGVQELVALDPPVREAVIAQSESCEELQQLASFQSKALVLARGKALQSQKVLVLKNQLIRRLRQQLEKQKEKMLQKKRDESSALDIVRHKGRRLTWRGSVAVGLRKAICVVSASSFPLASLIETSRWTVTRCEIMVWAHILARHRSFHEYAFALLRFLKQWLDTQGTRVHGDEDSGLQLVVHAGGEAAAVPSAPGERLLSQDAALHEDMGLPHGADGQPQAAAAAAMSCCGRQAAGSSEIFLLGGTFWCGDATNASIWNRQKLQGLQFSSSFMVSWKALCANNLERAFRTWHGMLLCVQWCTFALLTEV